MLQKIYWKIIHEPKIIFFSGLHHNLMVTSSRIFDDTKIFGPAQGVIGQNVIYTKSINTAVIDIHTIIISNYYRQV